MDVHGLSIVLEASMNGTVPAGMANQDGPKILPAEDMVMYM